MIDRMVYADTLPQAYHHALWVLSNVGSVVDCPDYNTRCKEIGMAMCITEPLKEPMISRCIPCGPEDLQQYVMEMLDGIMDFEVERGNWAYTYHDRYAVQIPAVIDELKRDPNSRRAVMVIMQPNDICSSDPPCLQHIQYTIRKTPKHPDGQLNCFVLFRSNDAVKATFMNAFALIMLQKRIADEIGISVGTYLHRANSFHAYERDWDLLDSYALRNLQNTYFYDGDWKEQMEDAIPSILDKVNKQREKGDIYK